MKEFFQQLGLTAKEMKTFVTMLELGAQPISIIAKHVGVPRSSMYVILERLKRMNLIEEFERLNITYVKTIPVKNIADVLHAKERQIEQTLNILEEQLPQLEALENKLSISPKVKFYDGKEEVMRIYEAALKEKEFNAAFNPELVKRTMPEYIDTIAENLQRNNGRAKELLVDSKEARRYKEKFSSSIHQIKILPVGVIFPSDTIICKDKIYMIAYGEQEVFATEIINLSLAKTQWILFEELWKTIP